MDFSYYIFAGFVFVLAAFLVLMIKKVKGADAKNEKIVDEKEKKLFKLYQSLEEMISDAEEFADEVKKDISADKKDIKSMLEKADNLFQETQDEIYNHLKSMDEAKSTAKKSAPVKKKAAPKKPMKALSRNEKVRLLKKEGKSIEDISKQLSISQGEVALIIGLER